MDDGVEVEFVLLATFGLIAELLNDVNAFVILMTYAYLKMRKRTRRTGNRGSRYSIKANLTHQLDNMHFLVEFSDETCKNHLRMNINCFNRLCYLLQNLGGLSPTRHVTIGEQVAIFLTVLSHHTKNRIIKHTFRRSGYTVSKYFNRVLNTLLKLHTVLLVQPEPVPDNSTDYRWKYFKVIFLMILFNIRVIMMSGI